MVDGPLVGAGARGKAWWSHAISLRKVGVLIGVYVSTVTYQNISALLNTSLSMTQSTLLFTEVHPQTAVRPATPRLHQTQTQTHSSLLQRTCLYRSFRAVFLFLYSKWTYQSVYTDGKERRGEGGGDLIWSSDYYNSATQKRKKTESHILIFQNESIRFLSVR